MIDEEEIIDLSFAYEEFNNVNFISSLDKKRLIKLNNNIKKILSSKLTLTSERFYFEGIIDFLEMMTSLLKNDKKPLKSFEEMIEKVTKSYC